MSVSSLNLIFSYFSAMKSHTYFTTHLHCRPWYSAIHPVCRNVLLRLLLKVATACMGSTTQHCSDMYSGIYKRLP